MKLRRAVATAVAAAAIAPATLFAAPAAFAESAASASPAPSVSTTVSVAPSAAATTTDMPSSAPTYSPSALPSNPELPITPQELDCTAQDQSYKAALTVTTSGLPGKIAAGSGWHEFTMTIANPSSTAVQGILLGAGVAPVGGATFFDLSKVTLQVQGTDNKWYDLADDNATSFGLMDGGDLNGGDSFDIKLRLEVDKSAPLGMSFALGIANYPDDQHECFATADAAYEMQIVAPGKPTGGTPVTPPKSGSGTSPVPLPKKPPAKGSGTKVIPVSYTTGSGLAKTGASSATPVIAGIGGAAVVLGAGAMFVVRRRKSGSAA